MSWGIVAGAAVGLVGSAVQGRSARNANRSQQDASMAALEEQRRQYDLQREDTAPYREAGRNALARASGLAEQYSAPFEYQNDPGYQFGMSEGMRALEGSAAARGGLYSGNTLKALTRYGNDYATTKYGEAFNRNQTTQGNNFNRFATLAGIGQTGTQQAMQASQNFGNAASGLYTGMGNANAAASLAQGNIWGNALNQVGSAAGRRFGSPQQNPYQAMPTYGTDYGE